MTNPSGRPDCVLLLGAGDRLYRGYALEAAARRHRLVLLDAAAPTWQLPYLAGHATADITDLASTRAAVRLVAERYVVRGVLTWNEFAALTAARIADDLDLPGPPPAAVAACRDKSLMRTALDRAAVPSARWHRVAPHHQAAATAAAAAEIGYPLVVKPVSGAGSRGVVKVDRPQDLPAALAFAAQASLGTGLLLEEHLAGPEVSIEAICDHGLIHIVAVTRKSLGPEPWFEETGHLITPAATSAEQAAARVAEDALRAVGLIHGAAHIEVRLTAHGPRIIEINPRLGGDLIPHLVHLATGIDMAAAAVDLALGTPPVLEPTRRKCAGVAFHYPATAGTLTEAGFLFTPTDIDGIERAVLEQRPGNHVAPPPDGGIDDRIAHFVAAGSNPAQVRERLATAATALNYRVTPGVRTR
ncbi:acetyl-CoA carboxylase biotin carboxylase subunit family protein [Kitasatospora sp. NPDC088783]|uniref:ATP-grasp domain-containing protein n=1 Tax=Kitasatospora sp. NPDC088783 TaxID=3364077 RepID=UPI00381D0CBA